MWLQTRMYLLIAVIFGILYGVITGIGNWMGADSAWLYIILVFIFLGIQYLAKPRHRELVNEDKVGLGKKRNRNYTV